MVAEIAGQDVLADLGSVAGALLAIGALITGSLALLRRVLRSEVQPIVEQFSSNGGTTARDALDRLEEAVAEIRTEGQTERSERIARQQEIDVDSAEMRQTLTVISHQLDHHLAWHQAEVEQGSRAANAIGGDQ